jgi:MFS family permease
MTEGHPAPSPRRSPAAAAAPRTSRQDQSARAVLQNRPFLLLWLAQVATQVGGNMVIYGLTILISAKYASSTAVGALLLSFLVPAIIFSAPAGVFVDRVDKRHMLIVTNVLRALAFLGIFFVGDNLLMLYTLMVFVSTTTTFFGPAEASMIPFLVPRKQLIAANGLFTLTTNAAFAAGFALFGPFLVAVASPQALILVVAALYLAASVVCFTLPSSPGFEAGVGPGQAVADAERAVEAMLDELVEGIRYIRDNLSVGWSLTYLGITGALVGVLGALGPGYARSTLALGDKDFALVVLPLGLGIVVGIIALNAWGHLLPRRRLIEAGMIGLGLLVAWLSAAGPISRFLEQHVAAQGWEEVSRLVSLLGMVMGIAFLAGCGYAMVAISAQTQLQEDLPEEVRGRVFGILNMLVSIASFAPIIIVAPLADIVGVPLVLFIVSIPIALSGVASVVSRGPLRPAELTARATAHGAGAVDPVTVASHGEYVTVPDRPVARPLGVEEDAGRR